MSRPVATSSAHRHVLNTTIWLFAPELNPTRVRGFGMMTTTDRLAGALVDLVAAHGCSAGFTGVELTRDGPLDLAADAEEQYRQLLEAVRACERRGAEAVIVAGGPLSETARRLRETVDVTIVEPVPAACALVRARVYGVL